MKIESFKAGRAIPQGNYKSFVPVPVNQEWTWDDPAINTLLERATRAVSELNAFSLIVPHVDLFIQMHVIKEASTSSKIEGTKTNIEDAVKDAEDIAPEKRDDWQEVQNYIEAMNTAIADLKKLPLSNRILKQAHQILMTGVRGKNKRPGEFRATQNWIGGTDLQNAVFIPPPHQDVPELMADLEKFLHNKNINVPFLIRIAIAHYQFETIHPFLDGNGRIGRLLITLYMVSTDYLHEPSLYLSDWLEKNRSAYYDALMAVRTSNNMKHWIKFFLTAVAETAEKGKSVFNKILVLQKKTEAQIVCMGRRAENAKRVIELLYKKPSITAQAVRDNLGSTLQTANMLIKELEEKGILKEITGFKRNRIYIFHEYLNLFRD